MSVDHMDLHHAPQVSCSPMEHHYTNNIFTIFFNVLGWGMVLYIEFLYSFIKIVTFPFVFTVSRTYAFFGKFLCLPKPTEDGIERAQNDIFSEAAKTVQFQSFHTEVLKRQTFLYSFRADNPESAEYKSTKIPLVLLHEMAGGVGCWGNNIEAFANHRPTYAIDLLELDYVTALEDWRRAMGIEKMILLGHQFGGFIASSYSLEHPNRVRHLILIEPWGFQDEPQHYENLLQVPLWMKGVGMVLSFMLPLFFVRAVGPLGVAPKMLRMFNASLMKNCAPWKPAAFSHYFYECNAQDPSGERSFLTMSHFCWPRRPMIQRFVNISPKLPVTFIYGSRSTFDREIPKEVQDKRLNSFTCVQEIWCGSRPHIEAPTEFNNDILVIADMVDVNEDVLPPFVMSNSNFDDQDDHDDH